MAQEAKINTFQGEIISVQKYNLVTQPAPYVQFILRAQGEEYTVEVGPEWYVHSQGILFIPQEEIGVQGFFVQKNQKKILLAKKLCQGNREFHVRDDQGKPLWSMEE